MGGWPDGFFATTPRLYVAAVEGRTRAERRRFRMTGWLAHTTASLERAKKIPALEKLVGGPDIKPRSAEPPSPGMLLSIARRWQVAISARPPHAG